jgi:hypothetical protein
MKEQLQRGIPRCARAHQTTHGLLWYNCFTMQIDSYMGKWSLRVPVYRTRDILMKQHSLRSCWPCVPPIILHVY